MNEYCLMTYLSVYRHQVLGECTSQVVESFLSEKEAKDRENTLKALSSKTVYGDPLYKYKEFAFHHCIGELKK